MNPEQTLPSWVPFRWDEDVCPASLSRIAYETRILRRNFL